MPPAFLPFNLTLLTPARTAGSANPVAFHFPRPRFLFVPYSLSTLCLCSPVISLSYLFPLFAATFVSPIPLRLIAIAADLAKVICCHYHFCQQTA